MFYDRPVDIVAEYDSQATVDAVKSAIESGGYNVKLIEADFEVFEKLQRADVDILFNLAEGINGEGRESLLPCICESLRIPYTGSGPLTLAICLDKAWTKKILCSHGIPVPRFQVLASGDEAIDLEYPLILKLLAEGSSIGLGYDSVVYDEVRLREKARRLLSDYGEKVLAEEYIDGREFTVPVIGNNPPEALPIVEVVFDKVPAGKPNINLFSPDESVMDMIEELGRETEVEAYNHTSVCPARLDGETEKRIKEMALRAYQALECKDWCRVDFRLDRDDRLFVLELNPIAGIDPTYLFPASARAYGLSYAELINRILDYAVERYELLKK
jgi:D-alanine-D-alanine ligase